MRLTRGLIETWSDLPEGQAWLDEVESRRDEMARRWGLRLGQLFDGSNVSCVWPARRADGSMAVLKLNMPEAETEHEPDALRDWGGQGAVLLLDADAESAALLVERCVPGIPLDRSPEPEANGVAADILRQLQASDRSSAPYRELGALALGWRADFLSARAADPTGHDAPILDRATGLLDELVGTEPSTVVLHQDLHGGNILLDDVRGWLAIDPKPLQGDAAFDAASLLRDRRPEILGDPSRVARMRWRIDALVDLVDLDRRRVVGWGIVHALAWSGGGRDAQLVECARLIAEAAAA